MTTVITTRLIDRACGFDTTAATSLCAAWRSLWPRRSRRIDCGQHRRCVSTSQRRRQRRSFPIARRVLAAIGNTGASRKTANQIQRERGCSHVENKIRGGNRSQPDRAMLASQAHAESTGGSDAEIALLRQQLRLMEQKLDKLQKQTTANTTAAANANAKGRRHQAKVANANAAIPVKGPVVRRPVRDGDDAGQPADHLHRRRAELRRHSPAASISTAADTTIIRTPRRPFRSASTTGSTSAAPASAWSANSWATGISASSTTSAARRTDLAAPASVGGAGRRIPARRRRLGHRERLSQLHRLQTVRRQARDRRRHHGYSLHAGRSHQLERHHVHGARLLRRHRDQYRRRRFPLHRRRALVQRQVLGRRLCDGADHGRHPLRLQHQPQRHHRTIRRRRPRRGAGHQHQRLHAPHRRRRPVADPAAA